MREKIPTGGATFASRSFKRGSFTAEVKADGDLYRFVIRDEKRLKPSIHGAKKSLHETESEVNSVLDRLIEMERAA